MGSDVSPLEAARLTYRPQLPAALRDGITSVGIVEDAARPVEAAIREQFPHTSDRPLLRLEGAGPRAALRRLRIGVVLSGGQAPGGHNVVAGLVDAALAFESSSVVFGFLGGPAGILARRHVELSLAAIAAYR